jgi:hypothetical protein
MALQAACGGDGIAPLLARRLGGLASFFLDAGRAAMRDARIASLPGNNNSKSN